jgi:hypothetical protein
MRSIHTHTAKIPDSPNITTSQQIDISTTIQIGDNSISFKHACLSPPIILVGTNKNKIKKSNRNEIIKQKFDKMKEYFNSKIYAKHIVEPYFAIDTEKLDDPLVEENLDPKEEKLVNDKMFKSDAIALRKIIELVALNEPYMGEQQPLKWMKFEKSLEKLKNKGLFYASLSQVIIRLHFLLFWK